MSERKPRITRVRGRKAVERPPPSIGEYEVADSWPPLSLAPQAIEAQPIHKSNRDRSRIIYIMITIIIVSLIWSGTIIAITHPEFFKSQKTTVTATLTSTETSTVTTINTKIFTTTETKTISMRPSTSINVANALARLLKEKYRSIEDWKIDSIKYMLSGFLYDGELREFELKSLNETLHQHLNLTLDNDLIALIMALQSAYSSGNLNEEIDDICNLAIHALDIGEEDCKSVLSQSGGSSRS